MKTIITFLLLAILSIGVSAQYGIPVQFETALEDTSWAQFGNAPDTSSNFMMVANPDKTGINTSDSCIMFIVTDTAVTWAGAWSDAYGPFEITAKNSTWTMMVHKDVISNCGLKFEGGTDPTQLEVKVPNTVTGEWEMIEFDMSAGIGNTYTRLVFFPDFPDERTAGSMNYIDNISMTYNYSLPVNFEIAMEDTSWTQFGNAPDTSSNFMMVANPDKTGINASDSCIMFIVTDTAVTWAGAWSDAYDSIKITAENYVMQMMVYKDVISNCGLKVEGGTDPSQIELKVPNTVTGEWELLEFNFFAGIGNTYTRLVFFPDFPDERTAGSTTYIDNIDWGVTPVFVREVNNTLISIFPNPATEMLTVQCPEMRSISIINITGQRVRLLDFQATDQMVIGISDLKSGLYIIAVESASGRATSKFIVR